MGEILEIDLFKMPSAALDIVDESGNLPPEGFFSAPIIKPELVQVLENEPRIWLDVR